MIQKNKLMHQLMHDSCRKSLIQHPFLLDLRNNSFSTEQMAIILGQWFHPLHHFPVFLAEIIAIAPNLSIQTAISKILWQELGEGDPKRSHETIFVDTMSKIGFDENSLTNSKRLPETEALIRGFQQAVQDGCFTAVAFAYGTEAADLAMVSGIGHALSKSFNLKNLEWVNIHIQQEPDHTDSVDSIFLDTSGKFDENDVLQAARSMWQLWADFFTALSKQVTQVAACAV